MLVTLHLDSPGVGGISTVNEWYGQWMSIHRPGPRYKVYLTNTSTWGEYLTKAPRWEINAERLPRLLPRLQLPPYVGARLLLRRYRDAYTEVHTVGGPAVHGSLIKAPVPSLVWIGTTIGDERRAVMRHHLLHRRVAFSWSLPVLERLERGVFDRATRVLAQSPHTARLIVRLGIAAAKVAVLPVPIDCEVFRPSSEPRQGVLFVGRPKDPRKNFRAVVRLMKESAIAQQRGLTVLSDDDPSGFFPPNIARFISWQRPAADPSGVFRRAQVLLLPSWQEGLGIVAFEALASGTPVVAYRSGGPDDYLRSSGGGFMVDDEVDFHAKTERLLRDDTLREEMGGAGRDWVKANMSASEFLADDSLFRV